jgi:hypothetical protein
MFSWSISALAFDRDHRKLLVLHSSAESYRLTRCEPDGTSCTSTAVPLPFGDSVMLLPTEDAVTMLARSEDRIHVVRCAPEGSPCTKIDVLFGSSLFFYGATHDPSTGELLLVVVADDRKRTLTLHRCHADGSACVEHDMSAGEPVDGIESPTAHFDVATRTALAVTHDATTRRASLFALSLEELPPPTDAGVSDGGGGGGGKAW